MRALVWLLLAVAGCRGLLGIDEPTNPPPGSHDASASDDSHRDSSAQSGGEAGGEAGGTIDAPLGIFVMTVDCNQVTPAVEIVTIDGQFHYQPSTATIGVGQAVKFRMSSVHDVVPDATMSDPGLAVGFGQTQCLGFTHAGTYGFHCSLHNFTGSITVQ